MATTENRRRRWDGPVIPVLLCLCFIASSLFFLVHMIARSQEENNEYFYNAANQKKISIIKQIEGDLQTLEGLAIALGGMEDTSRERLMPILKEINDNNAFLQMGVAKRDGDTWLIDVNGKCHEQNLKDMQFFTQALEGSDGVSDILPASGDENAYVMYYGVGIRNADGDITEVLCAVHSAGVLRKIIDTPVLSGEGFSNIVDGEGNYILRSVHAVQADIPSENKKRISKAAAENDTDAFTIINIENQKQRAVIIPLLDERWYLYSVVPETVLRERYIKTAEGVMAIIVVACAMFILFIVRQRISANRAQSMLMKVAYWDSLTGLRNFDGFKREVKTAFSGKDISSYVLWYGDVKKFKFINDMLGYEEGDRILKLIAGRLEQEEGKDSIVCRVSADNFAGMVRYRNREALKKKVVEIQKDIKESSLESRNFIELSVGFYCLSPGDEKISFDVLMNYANMARRLSKDKPGKIWGFYDNSIREKQIEDSLLEAEAEKALENGEFKVYMQPKVNIQNQNILSGAEALVRWVSPERGLISPGRFIPLFEKSDRIVMLDRYMFREVCRWLQRYFQEGGRRINISVNVSKVGILRRDFISYYARVKEEYGIPDGIIELEFTEGILLNDTNMFTEIVERLQERGFICSLDDFGSGYSSLNLLKELPIDVLKLDIMFFRNSRDLNRERIVVRNFIQMARELKIKTIAEGVEKVDSVNFLKECGCNVIQGFTFFKPMPLDDFERLVKEKGDTPLAPQDVG